jgi:glycine oxidase
LDDCLIIGGGVVGLSLAYELAVHRLRVRVIDSGPPGREASWAGAGILPPASPTSRDPLEQLTALSNKLHRQWSEQLRGETGVDNGLRRCGGLYLARDEQSARALDSQAAAWRAAHVAVEDVRLRLGDLEPNLQPVEPPRAAYLLPDEFQIRNPRHLKALLAGCTQRGVEVTPGLAAEDFDVRGGKIHAVLTAAGPISAGTYCLATGAWTRLVARRLGLNLAVHPVRGQIALLATPAPLLERIVNEGRRYLVPRADGRLLVGSTEEDAGFDRQPTDDAIAGLVEFAKQWVPKTCTAELERTWAGLRPATADGLPYLGRVPGLANAVVAAGHFRSGLQLSPGTATVIGQLIRGLQPEIDLTPFRLDRH